MKIWKKVKKFIKKYWKWFLAFKIIKWMIILFLIFGLGYGGFKIGQSILG